jgi:hypothetical protein
VRKLLLLLLVTCAACGFGACASKNKSSAHIYEGDAPTIRMAPSEAGGPHSVY